MYDIYIFSVSEEIAIRTTEKMQLYLNTNILYLNTNIFTHILEDIQKK